MIDLDRLAALEKAATSAPWEQSPNTAAGAVWVSSRGDPLAEPVSPRDWVGRVKRGAKLFLMRSDIPRRVSAGNVGDPNWQRQEANAALIAESRNALPALLSELRALRERVRLADELLGSYLDGDDSECACFFDEHHVTCLKCATKEHLAAALRSEPT